MNVPAKTKSIFSLTPTRCVILALSFIAIIAFIIYQTQKRSSVSTESLHLPEAQITQSELLPEWKTLTIHPGDVVSSLLTRAGISQSEIQAILNIQLSNRYLLKLNPAQHIKIQVNQQNQLLAYTQTIDRHQRLNITRNTQGFYHAIIEPIPLETRVTFGQAKISDSLFVSGIRAGMDDALIMKLAEIFAYDIDFALDIRPGDSFSMLYEEKFLEGKKIGTGAIIAAEFKTQGRTYHAIRYVDGLGKADYFSPNGTGLHKAFIRTPVNYTRISSHFNLKRQHPILHKIRAHKGVDYAAPRGTPVKAVGDGIVTFLGTKGGYGETLIIQHGVKQGKKYTTLYAHLSRFSPFLRSGHKVKQGQIVAYVGSSGLATAPHLHYEFHVDGVHRNPLTVALPRAEGLQGLQTPRFLEHARNVLTLMAYHETISNKTVLASNE